MTKDTEFQIQELEESKYRYVLTRPVTDYLVALAPKEPIQETSPPSRNQHTDLPTRSHERTLLLSSLLVSEGKHEAAIRALRSACNGSIPAEGRAQCFLWLGQVGCKIMEYMNASCDTAVARDIYIAIQDRAGRIQCDIVLARIARERAGVSTGEDTKLAQLFDEAKRHRLEAIEVQLLCEICRVACSAKDIREDLTLSVEQAQESAHRLGDTWLKAECLRAAGMVSEARGDHKSALQAYSTSFELYHESKAPSPRSPVKDVEADIQRMKTSLSRRLEKPKSRFRKFF
ncbi:hypothetical protein OPQ81_003200 [Rhizoctonia solani]|nr:hypothetical protein OPQ81_003200 [Rhizoctonia solani]